MLNDVFRVCVFLVSLCIVGGCLTDHVRASENSAARYKLMPGDRIAVTVFGQADLSGDFAIDGVGNILMPLVGSIPVAHLTPSEVEQTLVEQLSHGVLARPSVSVRISEYRPVYVVGDVKTPGAYPFKYGLSVLGLMALAGGPARNATAQAAASGDFLSADERVRVLEASRLALLVLISRLEAMRDNRSTLDLTALAPLIGAKEEIKQLIKQESDTLASELGSLNDEITMFNQQKPRLEKEREAYQTQLDAENRLAKIIEKRISEYEKIDNIGLGRSTVLSDFEKDKSRSESSIARAVADLSHVDHDVGEVDIKIHQLRDQFMRRTMGELGDAMRHLQETEISLMSARKQRELRSDLAGMGPAASIGGSFVIHRGVDDNQIAIPAMQSTPLEPGDILDVKNLIPLSAEDFPIGPGLNRSTIRVPTPEGAVGAPQAGSLNSGFRSAASDGPRR
jgi:polysaccharide biosynthesis/export protein